MKKQNGNEVPAITSIFISGYKSIQNSCRLDMRPLTIIAGPNSSGKSSLIQPLLLLKQTLESRFDPGPLRIDGTSISFQRVTDFVPSNNSDSEMHRFSFGIEAEGIASFTSNFQYDQDSGLNLNSVDYFTDNVKFSIFRNSSENKITSILKQLGDPIYEYFIHRSQPVTLKYKVERNRFTFGVSIMGATKTSKLRPFADIQHAAICLTAISSLIYIPGLRGNPERNYPKTSVGKTFEGYFQDYVASIIASWRENRNKDKLVLLNSYINELELTWTVEAVENTDVSLEMRVGRLQSRGSDPKDLVNIADVGLGISQSLPVIVALVAAKKGQTVFVEQPEIHLHPKAQYNLARIIADAVKRGVRVIVETHSDTFILSIQTLIAADTPLGDNQKLLPEDVALYWCERDTEGITRTTFAEFDSLGRFGAWPANFGSLNLEYKTLYLDSVDEKYERLNNDI